MTRRKKRENGHQLRKFHDIADDVPRRIARRVTGQKRKKLEENTNAMVVPIVNHRRKYNNTERKRDKEKGREKGHELAP